jgi:hypothetical protein
MFFLKTASIGLVLLIGVVLAALAIGGVVLVVRGYRAVKAAKAAGERVPVSAYVQMGVGALLLLPLAGWIAEAVAWGFGFALFNELIGSS